MCIEKQKQYVFSFADESFSKIDVDGDNVLSFREVIHFLQISAFLSPVSIEFIYRENIKNIYNYSELFEPLWFQYAANIFFNSYKDGGASMTGYITKDVFFDHYSVGKMNVYDDNGDNFVNFDEFTLHFFGNSTVNLLQTVSNNNVFPHQSHDFEGLLNISNITSIDDIELLIFPSTINDESVSRRRLSEDSCFDEHCTAEGTYSMMCYNDKGDGTCYHDADQCYDDLCMFDWAPTPKSLIVSNSAGTEHSANKIYVQQPTPQPTSKPWCYGGSNQMLVNREDTISEMSLSEWLRLFRMQIYFIMA